MDTIERYVPTHLNLWKLPKYCVGETFENYYVVMGRHRDSDLLDESNWERAETMLTDVLLAHATNGQAAGEDGPEMLKIARASHWAVGWCETMLVHKDAPEALLREADKIVCALANYPVLDESDFCQREEEAAQSWWAECGTHNRILMLKQCGLSIFAAKHRHYAAAADDNGRLREILLGN